ncbi:MAG: FCD domain-containing protein [Desulfarculaceae bacterium]|jgi:DNA-binding FadR family transcriptional regulator
MFRKVRSNSVVEDVINQIEEAILSGSLKAGDKLPATRELQRILGISQGTLREALRVLDQMGLIQVKQGSKGGVFVREANSQPVSDCLARLIRQRQISLDDLAGFRRVIEGGLIRLVVERATKKDVAALKAILVDMKAQAERGPSGWHGLLEVEVRLRKALIRLSGSVLYEAVLVPIHDNIFAYAGHLIPGKDANVEEAYKDWRQIVEAIAKRDADIAEEITQDHIDRYAERMRARLQERQKKRDQKTA